MPDHQDQFKSKEELLAFLKGLTSKEVRRAARLPQVTDNAKKFGVDLGQIHKDKLYERSAAHSESEERTMRGIRSASFSRAI